MNRFENFNIYLDPEIPSLEYMYKDGKFYPLTHSVEINEDPKVNNFISLSEYISKYTNNTMERPSMEEEGFEKIDMIKVNEEVAAEIEMESAVSTLISNREFPKDTDRKLKE